MSRIGKSPVPVPDGVTVSITDATISAQGPKGTIEQAVHPAVEATFDEGARQIIVSRRDIPGTDTREARGHSAIWGTTRKLIANMIEGVTKGYSRKLLVVGVGYGATVQGAALTIRCGLANELKASIPEGLTIDPPEAGNLMITGLGQLPCTTLTIHGVDLHLVNQFAAAVRHLRPPEPYKGKGIRYADEEVKRKAGKALAAGSS